MAKDDGTIENENDDIVIKRVYNEPKIYKESNNNKNNFF